MGNSNGKNCFAFFLMVLAYFKFLPLIIIPIIAFYSCQIIHSNNIKEQERRDSNIIVSSDATIRVFGLVRDNYNKGAFSRILADEKEQRILYVFKDSKKSAAEYDELVKDEITTLYNILQNKTFKDTTIYNNKATGTIKLFFYIPDGKGNSSSLCSAYVKYKYDGTVTEEVFKDLMSKEYVSSDKLNSSRKGDSYPLEEYTGYKDYVSFP